MLLLPTKAKNTRVDRGSVFMKHATEEQQRGSNKVGKLAAIINTMGLGENSAWQVTAMLLNELMRANISRQPATATLACLVQAVCTEDICKINITTDQVCLWDGRGLAVQLAWFQGKSNTENGSNLLREEIYRAQNQGIFEQEVVTISKRVQLQGLQPQVCRSFEATPWRQVACFNLVKTVAKLSENFPEVTTLCLSSIQRAVRISMEQLTHKAQESTKTDDRQKCKRQARRMELSNKLKRAFPVHPPL